MSRRVSSTGRHRRWPVSLASVRCLADSQLLIGDIGLFLANDGSQAEIGFTLRRESQGQGMATAAVCDAIEFLFEQTDVQRVIAITDARNLPSVRLLERVGMRKIETRAATFRDQPCIEHVYALSRPV